MPNKLMQRLLTSLVGVMFMIPAAKAAQDPELTAVPAKSTYAVLIPKQPGLVRKIKRIIPGAWQRTLHGETYLQVGFYQDNYYAQQLVNRLQRQNLSAIIDSQTIVAAAPVVLVRPKAITVTKLVHGKLQTPVLLASIGDLPQITSFDNLPTIPVVEPIAYTTLTRVLVPAQDYEHSLILQKQVLGKVHRQWKGRTYIQVGAFSQPDNLNQMLQSLQSLGLQAVLQAPEEQ